MIRGLLPAILLMMGVMQLRGDGYFPFPREWPIERLLWIVLPHTIAMVGLCAYAATRLMRPGADGMESTRAPVPGGPPYAWLFPVCACLLVLIVALHLLQWRRFQSIGYEMSIPVLTGAVAASLLALAAGARYVRTTASASPLVILAFTALGSFAMKLVPLVLFPVTAWRSDALPIVREGAASLLQGTSPYQYYVLSNGIPTSNPRLPGLLLTYAPAVFFDLDLRWVTLAFEALAIGAIIWYLHGRRSDEDARLVPLVWALAILLMFPYWHYRHELYEAPFWFVLVLAFIGLDRSRRLSGRVLFTVSAGLLIGMHQWGWLFAPFLLIAYLKRTGPGQTLLAGALASAIGGALVLAPAGFDIASVAEHALGTYDRMMAAANVYPLSMYFTIWFVRFDLHDWLRPLQIVIQLGLLALAFRGPPRLDRLAAILALSLTCQLMLNPVAWTYQYLLVVLLLVLALGWNARETASDARLEQAEAL